MSSVVKSTQGRRCCCPLLLLSKVVLSLSGKQYSQRKLQQQLTHCVRSDHSSYRLPSMVVLLYPLSWSLLRGNDVVVLLFLSEVVQGSLPEACPLGFPMCWLPARILPGATWCRWGRRLPLPSTNSARCVVSALVGNSAVSLGVTVGHGLPLREKMGNGDLCFRATLALSMFWFSSLDLRLRFSPAIPFLTVVRPSAS